MRSLLWFVAASALALCAAWKAEAGCQYARCGGCSDPCAGSQYGGCGSQACLPAYCGPATVQRVVMVPKYVCETRTVCSTEYKQEERQRTYTVYNTVPVTEERVCVETVMVPKTETKTIEYTVSVPVKEAQTKQYTVSVPMWKETTEEYMIKVPELKEVAQQYQVEVPEVKEVPFTYSVSVPYAETRTAVRTIINCVPVVKTKMASVCVPVSKTKKVTKDCGYWETRVMEVACHDSARCGGCGGCGGCTAHAGMAPCGPATMSVVKRVWVPNLVTEDVPCVVYEDQPREIHYTVYEQQMENVPYQYTMICYKPEERTGTTKVVEYKTETRTRPTRMAEYKEVPRTRVTKVLSYKEETRTETYPVIRYEQQTRTKQVSYTVQVPEQRTRTYKVTRYDCVPEQKIETCTVSVPVPVTKEVQVQVCRMVPKVVNVDVTGCGCDRCLSCCGH